MSLVRNLAGDPHTYIYTADVPSSRAVDTYTPRVIPFFPHVAVPLEMDQIVWQK
jgi:hypothetical protein